jgi:steroid 5-alpha reductase family enzyme
MSLPVVRTLADCADIHKTVLPYLPQLFDLPQQVFQNINNLQALKVLYIATNPLVTALAVSLFLAPIFLIASEVNKNYSQVDRLWSILPTAYNAHFVIYAHAAGLPTKRLDILMLISGAWSVISLNSHT